MDFKENGINQIYLSEDESKAIREAFECASIAMDRIGTGDINVPQLKANSDSQHATGYHPLGGHLSSKYNRYREGFVFSDGDLFNVDLPGKDEASSFESTMEKARSILHNLAMKAVQDIETEMGLPQAYIKDKYGLGSSLLECSQWHLKRYDEICSKIQHGNGENEIQSNNDEECDLALGVHTDPSIVSVVIHDAPNIQQGGWGLEYAKRKENTTEWREVPWHGRGIATVMVGAAFARIMRVGENTHKNERVDQLRKLYPPVRHRVVMQSQQTSTRRRMALTYFLRPSPSSILEPLPVFTKLHVTPPRKQQAFGTWYQRVSSRYGKSNSK